jgi:hypothetical protein
MTRILLALAAAGVLSACALPEPAANTQSAYVEKETITGSRIPPKNHNSQGVKGEEVNGLNRDEIFRPKSTGLNGGG